MLCNAEAFALSFWTFCDKSLEYADVSLHSDDKPLQIMTCIWKRPHNTRQVLVMMLRPRQFSSLHGLATRCFYFWFYEWLTSQVEEFWCSVWENLRRRSLWIFPKFLEYGEGIWRAVRITKLGVSAAPRQAMTQMQVAAAAARNSSMAVLGFAVIGASASRNSKTWRDMSAMPC